MALGKSLGNILNNYFGDENVVLNSTPVSTKEAPQTGALVGEYRLIAISDIKANPFQTRIRTNTEDIDKLADSIRDNGLIQPIVVVRKLVVENDVFFEESEAEETKELSTSKESTDIEDAKNKISKLDKKLKKSSKQIVTETFVLIAGDRRIRACQKLGLKSIQAIVKDESEIGEKEHSRMSAVENLHRKDFNPIEKGRTFVMLMQTQGISADKLGPTVNLSGDTIRHYTRLLNLDPQVQEYLMDYPNFGEHHARHLINIAPELQVKIARWAVEKELSTREVIRLVETLTKSLDDRSPIRITSHNVPPNYIDHATSFTKSIPNATFQCFGDQSEGRIVVRWHNPKYKLPSKQ